MTRYVIDAEVAIRLADALITLDADLAASARQLVEVAPIEALYRGR